MFRTLGGGAVPCDFFPEEAFRHIQYHVNTSRARIEETEDPQEREELFHLLFAADPSRFDRWLRSAVERQRLPEVLEMVSVLSLRQPQAVREWVRRLLGDSPQLWQGVGGHERLLVFRAVLAGVR